MGNHRLLLRAVWLIIRPWRWSICGFRFMPLVLLAAGCWLAAYGAICRRITVTETHEEQITIPAPIQPMMPPAFSSTDPFGQPTGPQPPMGGFGQPPGPLGLPGGMGPPEAMVPPVKLIQATKIVTTTSDDVRSYHINSDKIRQKLEFVPKRGIEDAVRDLCHAFKAGKLPNSMSDGRYFNVRTMKARSAA